METIIKPFRALKEKLSALFKRENNSGFSILYYMKPFWKHYILVLLALSAAVFLQTRIPLIVGRLIDDVIVAGKVELLARLLITLILAGIGCALCNFVKEFTADVIGVKSGTLMRRDLFTHIQKLSVDYFGKNNSGELMARVKDDVDKIWFIVGFAGMLTLECIVYTVVMLVCMFKLSPLLTILPIIVMVIVAIIAVRMEKQLDKCYDELSEQNAELNKVAQENLSGVRTVKAFAREKFEIEKFCKHNEKYYKLNMALAKVQIKHQPYINFATKILIVGIVLIGGLLIVSGKEDMSLGDLSAFAEYCNNIIWPMECIAWLGNEIASAVASGRKIRKITGEKSKIENPANAVKPKKINGRVEFDNVSFSIDDTEILSDISFKLDAGKTLGIMGVTGSGKSTVVNLLERFYDVDKGAVRIDGIDLRRLDLSVLRSSVAVVMQEVFLFSDAIEENIRLGSGGKMGRRNVKRAAKLACASEFITELEEGYETIIGERGVGLSGGQKQRISIARAIAKKAPILVLDDATSALDSETEHELQNALRTIDSTKIIIAHRISSVREADEIIVLSEGRVAERGTHLELLKKKGLYYTTYTAQYGEEEAANELFGKEGE